MDRIRLGAAIVLSCSAWYSMGMGAELSFNRDVRPILSDHCFQCHGPDQGKRQGGLRLDEAAAALQGGDSGPAIVAGKLDESEVWQRVISEDPDLQMPPKSLGKPLSQPQRATLRRWIEEGAKFEGHWAFIPPQRPDVPKLSDTSHPVDAFIRARLQTEKLKPNPRAARETLIRRVTLDLTGLPPTVAEVDEFLADQSPQAFERVVDRLLASPHYGERLSVQWLDFARYADSNGFQTDSSRQMWAWRDWVIHAFNRNLPFDQFTIEQLAGDMLDNPTKEQLVATGFNRNTRLNGEGGRIVDEWFAETVIDRVETTGLTWLGLTLNCCRCHDHKYDPVTQKEFYQLFAIFNSIDESGVLDSDGNGKPGSGNSRPLLQLPTLEQESELEKRTEALKLAQDKLQSVKSSAAERQLAWEAEFLQQISTKEAAWKLLESPSVKSEGGAEFKRLEDGTWLASGTNPDFDVYTITSPIQSGQFTGLLLEAFPDPSLPNQSLGRYPNGNFVLSDVDIEITAPSLAEPLIADIVRAEADFEQNGWPIKAVLDGKPKKGKRAKNGKGWAVDGPSRREICRAMFVAASPLKIPEGATLKVTLRHEALNGHNMGRFRLSMSGLSGSILSIDGTSLSESLKTALNTPKDMRQPAQAKEIQEYFAKQADLELKQAEQGAATAKKSIDDINENIASTMIMKERPTPRDANLLIRGEYDRPGEKVERGLPAALAGAEKGKAVNRLEFARWLVARENPLTARVWVNRAWERFFGTGLVKSTENLGSQADWPSHPELLDWLAVEFMQPTVLPSVNGEPAKAWDMKALQKLLVMSETYQQSSQMRPELLERDPDNRLLARGPRFRLMGEVARDQALAVSGLLKRDVGGPSVRPYMPDGVWDETSRYGDLRNYKPDGADGLYRRSLYTIWKRTAAPPSMLLFDASSREVCTVKRSRTNTPLQALALLNEVTYIEAARKLAERMIAEGGASLEDRIRYGYRLVTARSPSSKELNTLVAAFKDDLQTYQQDLSAAEALLKVGQATSESANIAELAAYTVTANVLLNLDEVITRE